ncbi:MAG: amino acid ABC transporter permease [Anaerolineae bacterium]
MDFPFMLEILPRLLRGLVLTIQVSVLALLLGTVIGIALGIVRIIGPRPVQRLIIGYVTLIRGTPAIFHIYAASLLLPKIGIELSVFWVGLIALTVNTVGYQIEIVRAALESIDFGQREAAASIGMTNWMAMRSIILPQAARRMIPPLTNELANLIKASSALSVIAVLEMTKIANSIRASTFKSPEVYLLVAILYFIVIQLLIWGANYLEQNVFNYQRVEKRAAAATTTPVQAG